MKALRAFGRFWYEFIVGDDWKIAASVVAALAILAIVTVGGWFTDAWLALFGAALIVIAFVGSLLLDVRPKKHGRSGSRTVRPRPR
jgi:uncharacterized iron-regulated membrane protein